MNKNKDKEPKRVLRMSTLIWLVLFVFIVLVVSILVSWLIWQLFMRIGILAPFEAGRPTFLFLLTVSVLIGTTLAAIGGDYILRPLRRLTMATKEVAKGNFNVKVAVKGSTEIERLAQSFNEMAKELGSIETLRSDFVSNISHEFKTPVASIRGFAKRLLKGELDNEQREYLDIIVYESERLTRLSGNVLLLSNLESHPLKQEQVVFSLDEQLRRMLVLLEPQLLHKCLETEINLESVQIIGNEEMLHHVWLNILGNAIKFRHPGDGIKIRLNTKGTLAVITIADQGVGMDSEAKKRMFEKFYQADPSRATEGNGLGLSLVKKIIDLQGGCIEVDSEADKGTCFTISLPANPNEH